jgi:hypothetical protein
MAHHWRWDGCDEFESQYYPPPISRKQPSWAQQWLSAVQADDSTMGAKHRYLGGLYQEIYEALIGGQTRLAVMGIRAFLEQLMISKVGDNKSFENNLNAFYRNGYISLVQRDQMDAILDAGHAVIHRFHKPNEQELSTALDIAEGIFAAINIHGDAALKVADRVPPKPKTPKKDGSIC